MTSGAYAPSYDPAVREREVAALWVVMQTIPPGTDLPSAVWGAAVALQHVRASGDEAAR